MKKLYVIDGPNKGKSFNLNGGITAIGRSPDNDIRISDKRVSRHHGKFLQKDDRIFTVDLNSLQGVFIDGEKVKPGLEVEIKKESKVTIGKTILSFQKESSGKKPAKPYPKNVKRDPFDTSESLKDSTRDYIRSLELLLKVSNILAQSLNIDELLGEVIDQIFYLLKRIDRGAILLIGKETGKLQEVVSKTRMDDKEGIFSKINYSRTIVKRTIKEGEPVMMSDTRRVAKAELSDSMEQINIMSVMCVPLTYKGEVRGVIYVDSIGLAEGFRKDDLQLLAGLSNTAAIAIENARMYETVKQELSERKRAEEQIKASLKEKEVLLKEIHHRVKNNLQVMSSLLDMKIMRTDSQQIIDVFEDARSKIHTMALIHSQLYRSERFDQINMGGYIKELVSYLSQIYGKESRLITPVIEHSEVYLSMTQAIPCALALSELISNAFKHAFKEGQRGTIRVSLTRSPGNRITIRVKDDGIGIPEEVDIFETDSLGLKLFRNLIREQLTGEIQVNRDQGTDIFIEFDVLKEEDSNA